MIKHKTFTRANIYLSGGMQFCPPDDLLGAKWRTDCSTRLKKMGYFPIDIAELDDAYQAQHSDIMADVRFNAVENEYLRKASIRLHFIDTDLKLITADSDALIVLYDESARRGAGTISECQVAFNNDVPIFVMSAWEDWQNEVPAWLHALSTKLFTKFEDLYDYMDKLPEGILVRDQYGNHGVDNKYLCSLTGNVFEKTNDGFVSNIFPLYGKEAVDCVRHVNEGMKNRYQFFIEYIKKQEKEGYGCGH
jgi:hypothetical protein